MGQRSRKRRAAGSAPVAPEAASGDGLERGYARGRQRDERIRAGLDPYAEGERPLAIKLAVALALVVAVANVGLALAGWEVEGGGKQPVTGAAILTVLLLVAAAGMWKMRYWAVLGFQALLGISVIFAALSLMFASNAAAAVLCLAILGVAGGLFWFLIRVMARIQLPARRPQGPVG